MGSIVLTIPILGGKVEAWRRFCQELSGSRKTAHEAARLSQGITGERLALIESVYGAVSVTIFEAKDVSQAFTNVLLSDLPFDGWYREQIQILHGIQLDGYQQIGKHSIKEHHELLFEWTSLSTSKNGGDRSDS